MAYFSCRGMFPAHQQTEAQVAEPKIISIFDLDFTVSQPYEAGHTVTEAEAKALNQVRKENLGNNFRGTVKKAVEEAGVDADGKAVPLADAKIAELTATFTDLDSKYVFTLANATSSRKLEPWEREVRTLIKGAIREQLAAETPPRKMSDLSDEEVESIIDGNSDNPDIVKAAKKAIADRQKIAGFTLNKVGNAPAAA